MRLRPVRLVSAVRVGCLLAACGDGVADPGEPVLLGQFGTAEWPVELLATHAGVELVQPCGGYFVADRPAALQPDGDFRVRGRSFPGGLARGSDGATLGGRFTLEGGVETVTLSVIPDGAGAVADLLVHTLRRSEHYTGPELPCAL